MRVRVEAADVRRVFGELKGSSAFAESREIFERGRLPVEMLQAMSLRPELLRGFGATSEGVYPGGALPRLLKEKVILHVSEANRCQFCVESHRALLRTLELPDDSRTPLALRYTDAVLVDSNRIPDALFDELRAAFTDAEIVELTFLVGYINMLNWFNNALQVRYTDDYGR